MYRKSYVMPAIRANKISKLSVDSDSESDSDESCGSSSSGSCTEQVEEKVVSSTQETSPAFRVWKSDEGESRFTTEKNNIFSSPFSRKKVVWSRPRFRSEDSTCVGDATEGWVSIEKGLPPPTDDDLPDYAPPTPSASASASTAEEADDATRVEEAKPPQEFPSLLKRGSGSVEDQQAALAWAEKIKKNLDNAEKMRSVNRKQKEGGLSFFKRLQ